MGLFTLHNFCVPSSLDYLKTELKSKSRLPIPVTVSVHIFCFSVRLWFNASNPTET